MCSATAHVRYAPEADMPFPSLMLCGGRRTGQARSRLGEAGCLYDNRHTMPKYTTRDWIVR
jgi:hypothetical protein